jgi:O-antigen/teichoic acid export membrane protein
MLRFRRFVSAVGSGYASLVALSFFSLISIPFAVRYLGREGFGVAATIMQIIAFSQVLQLGIGPSVARFIVDYRNGADADRLGSFVKTAFVIGAIQAGILVCLALFATTWLSDAFNIPQDFRNTFENVTMLALCAAALGLATNTIQQLLYASQRIDLINYIAILTQGAATTVLVTSLIIGLGLFSYVAAAWAGALGSAVAGFFVARKLGILPPMTRAPLDWKILPSLAHFSSSVMMVSVGLQLIAIAPAIVINRLLGVGAMADWTIGTRLLQLGLQLSARVSSATEPTLWEIYAKGQKQWASKRLTQTVQISAAVAVVIGGTLLSLNGDFVTLWSGGRVLWPWQYDLIGSAILLVAAVAATWCMLPGITKRLGVIRYVYPLEAVGILAILCVPTIVTSAASVLAAMLISMVIVRLAYGATRAVKDLGQSASQVTISLIRPWLLWLLIMLIAGLFRYNLENNESWFILSVYAVFCATLFSILTYILGISSETKNELRAMLTHIRS